MTGKPSFQYFEICALEELPPGERLFIDVGEEEIVLFNIAGYVYAIGDVCTHDGGPLGEGELEGFEIVCPRPGARFDVRNGEATRLPAIDPTPSYPVRVSGGMVELGIPVTE
ncbi:MAG: non-heme iron oxygenase ferredoxin subunit [Anaerolineaceae bacterium]|nr:non-heme iron oxygenase ferredoxin subunit [Anaerolineaceae bacterium]